MRGLPYLKKEKKRNLMEETRGSTTCHTDLTWPQPWHILDLESKVSKERGRNYKQVGPELEI